MITEHQLGYLDSLGDGAVHEVGDAYHEQLKKIAELEAENARLREASHPGTLDELIANLCEEDPTFAAVLAEAKNAVTPEDAFNCLVRVVHTNPPKIDTSPERVQKSAESMHIDWPADDRRIEQIGREGNEGLAYGDIAK